MPQVVNLSPGALPARRQTSNTEKHFSSLIAASTSSTEHPLRMARPGARAGAGEAPAPAL